MMEPALAPFQEAVGAAQLRPPEIPFVSNQSGTWITDAEATDPGYWAQHIRQAVRFSEGIETLLNETEAVLLEVGPGNTLRSLTRQHPACTAERDVFNSLRHPREEASDTVHLARALGHLWAAGVDVPWERLYEGERRRRIPLPQYPFERSSHWIDADPKTSQKASQAGQTALAKQADIDDWFYVPSWKRSSPPARPETLPSGGTWLVFDDEVGLADEVLQRVEETYAKQDSDEPPRRLELGTPGDVDSLSLEPAARRAPGPGEIEIRVYAAALQFKDVLMALGMYADEPVPMGAECAGTVVRVGEGVDFEVGDDVIAAGFDSFQSFVTRDARMVVHKPASLRFEDAVTIPSGFLTAYHSIIRVANLQPGERVLVHAASGGVGQSAVQIAQMVGAEVYGTAGSPRKRDYLRDELGIEHVYDSRSLDFAEGIMADTGGEGIDVVLNSLTDEAIVRGLEILRPQGRFVELGKKDLYDDGNLPDVPNRDTIAYTIIDMDAEREKRTEAFQSLFREIMSHIDAGRLQPLPRSLFPWEEASGAFQYMSQTKHIGKVVLAMQAQPPKAVHVTSGADFEQVGADRFTIRPGRYEDYEALVEAIGTDRLRHVVHAWNVTPTKDARSESVFWSAEQDHAFYSLLHLGKALAAADPAEPLPIHVLSSDMQRVAGETALRPSKATLLGPCRVIPHEFPMLRFQSIDVESPQIEGPDEGQRPDADARRRRYLADSVAAELLAAQSDPVSQEADAAVAYRGMDRWIHGVERAQMKASREAAPQVRGGGVYLITGGLGGVGRVVAEHLARSKLVTLVLTSRSGLPPRSEWKSLMAKREEGDPTRQKIQTVLALEAHGAEVMVGAADVTDREAMQSLVDAVCARFGGVDGVIHAAGVVDDDLIPLKDPEAARRVLAPKVEGTLVLDEVLYNEPKGATPDFFILFSSVSALVGLPGQVDYTAANAFMDAFAQRKRTVDGVPALSINWSAWQEVGMAADIASVDKGGEVGTPARHPLLDRRLDTAETSTDQETVDHDIVFQSTWTPRAHWILDGHRNAQGQAILPGTGYLELARAAFGEAFGQEAIAIEDVYFVSPLEIRGGTARQVRVRLQSESQGHRPDGTGQGEAASPGAIAFSIESRLLEEGVDTDHWQEHAQGTVAPLASAPDETHDISSIADRCTRMVQSYGPTDRTRQEEHLRFGPQWRCLREVRYGDSEALARLELPDVFEGDLQHYKLHPALLDMATGFGLPLVDGYDERGGFYVPVSYEALELRRPLPRRLHSHMRCVDPSDQEMPSFDVTLMGDDGGVVAEITGFTMKRVPAQALAASSTRRHQASAGGAASSDGLAFDLSSGILPAEGVQALDRVLAGPNPPQVIVSTLDLPDWLKAVRDATAPARDGEEGTGEHEANNQAHEGHAGEHAAGGISFAAPRDEVETTLAEIWKGMLGMSRVGLRDDFFDIGGHSLIAVRMFAKVRKAYGLDLPLAVLIEAPTLGGFADVVRSELGIEGPELEAPQDEGNTSDEHASNKSSSNELAADTSHQKKEEGSGQAKADAPSDTESSSGTATIGQDTGNGQSEANAETPSIKNVSPNAPKQGATTRGATTRNSSGAASQPNDAPSEDESGVAIEPSAVRSKGRSTSGSVPKNQNKDRAWNPLVPIHAKGTRPPFFCVHGAGGNVLNFRDLAQYLGDDQPFYGLQARGVGGEQDPHARIEEMAAAYIDAIKTVQPDGPYRIGGYSGGGVVAFEMAHRLREDGDDVPLVALLDTFCPPYPAGGPSVGWMDKLSEHLSGIAEEGWTYGQQYMHGRWNFEQHRLEKMAVSVYKALGIRLPVGWRHIPLVKAYHDAVQNYDLQYYPGQITLFTARDKGPKYDHVPHHMGWDGLAAKLEIHKVPGTHDNLMLEPNVQELVVSLQEVLNGAETRITAA